MDIIISNNIKNEYNIIHDILTLVRLIFLENRYLSTVYVIARNEAIYLAGKIASTCTSPTSE